MIKISVENYVGKVKQILIKKLKSDQLSYSFKIKRYVLN